MIFSTACRVRIQLPSIGDQRVPEWLPDGRVVGARSRVEFARATARRSVIADGIEMTSHRGLRSALIPASDRVGDLTKIGQDAGGSARLAERGETSLVDRILERVHHMTRL